MTIKRLGYITVNGKVWLWEKSEDGKKTYAVGSYWVTPPAFYCDRKTAIRAYRNMLPK